MAHRQFGIDLSRIYEHNQGFLDYLLIHGCTYYFGSGLQTSDD